SATGSSKIAGISTNARALSLRVADLGMSPTYMRTVLDAEGTANEFASREGLPITALVITTIPAVVIIIRRIAGELHRRWRLQMACSYSSHILLLAALCLQFPFLTTFS